ncbi:uncharacterized protein [Anabrus simplex]|uniref:uncharacterized protein n=1 Tax=Anabrus simplex TaxID=316456 RepID=UPI0035A366E8
MSGKICAVYGCRNFELVKLSKSFFRFPRDKTVCDQWVLKCGRSDLDEVYKKEGPEYVNSTYRICSDHFISTDFRNPKLYSQGLKPNTVPTQNLPSSSVQGILGSKRRLGPCKRKREEQVEHNATSPSTSSAQVQAKDCVPDARYPKSIHILLAVIPNELEHSREMDAPPRPLSVTIKDEPDETDMELPFKTSVKTELVDSEGPVFQELVPEFPKELKYSPPIDLSAQPLCSVAAKSEPEEMDTELSIKTEVDELKTEIPDDNIEGNSSDGTSPNCASYSLPSSTGGVPEIPPIGNLCTSQEVITPYFCTLCQSRFEKECQLRSHLHSHHQSLSEDVGFSCFVCDKTYVKRGGFMRHILDFHPRVCPICREIFRSFWELHEHLSKYSDTNSYCCPRCSRVYGTTTSLAKHMNIRDYNCKLCNNKFSDHHTFNQHIKSHTQEVLTYDVCFESYSRTYATALLDSQLDFPKCEKKFATQDSLNCHLMRVHAPWNTLRCEMCNKIFLKRSLLVRHMAAHTRVRQLPCSMCKKRFKSLFALKRHEKIHSEPVC